MKTALPNRLSYFYAVLVVPVWQRIVLGVLAVLGTTDTIRSDIFSALPAVPHLPVLGWGILFVGALVPCILESSYRLLQAELLKNDGTEVFTAPGYAEGGTGGELVASGSNIRGTVSGGEGGRLGHLYQGGEGGSAEVHGIPYELGIVSFELKGGSGGGVQDGTGRGAPGAKSPFEEREEATSLWTYGFGGDGMNHPEFVRRLELLETFINEYYEIFPNRAPFVRVGIDLMPEKWVNKRLGEVGEAWRVIQREGRFILPRIE